MQNATTSEPQGLPAKVKFLGIPSKGAMIRAAVLAFSGTVAAMNFTPVLTLAVKGGAGNGVCATFDQVMSRENNRAMAEAMRTMETSSEIYTFASSTKQKICAGGVGPGLVAEYNPVSGRTLVKSLDQIGEGSDMIDNATTTAHEMYHAFQGATAKTPAERMARLYDLHSNLLTSLYMEAAAYAVEARIEHEHKLIHPERYSDGSHKGFLNFGQEMLGVYEEKYNALEGKPVPERANLATQAAFEYFLTSPGMAQLYRAAYLETFTKRTNWYMNPHRLFAFQRVDLEEVKSMTRLPNGFDLYRFDRLPGPSEVSEDHMLPKTEAAPDARRQPALSAH